MKNLTKEREALDRVPHVTPYLIDNPPPDVSILSFRVEFLAICLVGLVVCFESESYLCRPFWIWTPCCLSPSIVQLRNSWRMKRSMMRPPRAGAPMVKRTQTTMSRGLSRRLPWSRRTGKEIVPLVPVLHRHWWSRHRQSRPPNDRGQNPSLLWQRFPSLSPSRRPPSRRGLPLAEPWLVWGGSGRSQGPRRSGRPPSTPSSR